MPDEVGRQLDPPYNDGSLFCADNNLPARRPRARRRRLDLQERPADGRERRVPGPLEVQGARNTRDLRPADEPLAAGAEDELRALVPDARHARRPRRPRRRRVRRQRRAQPHQVLRRAGGRCPAGRPGLPGRRASTAPATTCRRPRSATAARAVGAPGPAGGPGPLGPAAAAVPAAAPAAQRPRLLQRGGPDVQPERRLLQRGAVEPRRGVRPRDARAGTSSASPAPQPDGAAGRRRRLPRLDVLGDAHAEPGAATAATAGRSFLTAGGVLGHDARRVRWRSPTAGSTRSTPGPRRRRARAGS